MQTLSGEEGSHFLSLEYNYLSNVMIQSAFCYTRLPVWSGFTTWFVSDEATFLPPSQ